MRVIFADCSAVYAGRGDTILARAKRALIIKSDGSISIHNDSANKPLNYMKMANMEETINEQGERVWTFDARHESLAVTLHELYSEVEEELVSKADEPGLVASGTEAQLQQWIFQNPHILGEGIMSVQREFPTGNGPVDLLVLTQDLTPIAVEVKRVATLGAADQARRYVESLREVGEVVMPHPVTYEEITVDFSRTIGRIAALDLRPRLLAIAEKRGLDTTQVPAFWRSSYDERE